MRRPVGILVLGLLVALLGAVGPGPAVAEPGAGDPPVLQRAPGPGENFPRLPNRCYQSDRRTLAPHPCRVLSSRGRPLVLLWGDSHAWMYLPAIRRLARQRHFNVVVMIAGTCPPATPFPRSSGEPTMTRCDEHNRQSLAFLRKQRRLGRDVRLVLGGFWAYYNRIERQEAHAAAQGTETGYTDYYRHMGRLGHERTPVLFRVLGRMHQRVDVMAPAGVVPTHPAPCARGTDPYQCAVPRRDSLDHEGANLRWLRRAMNPVRGHARLVNPTRTYCTPQVCRAHVAGRDTWFDQLHLGASFTATLTPFFRQTMAP